MAGLSAKKLPSFSLLEVLIASVILLLLFAIATSGLSSMLNYFGKGRVYNHIKADQSNTISIQKDQAIINKVKTGQLKVYSSISSSVDQPLIQLRHAE